MRSMRQAFDALAGAKLDATPLLGLQLEAMSLDKAEKTAYNGNKEISLIIIL